MFFSVAFTNLIEDSDASFLANACTPCGLDLGNATSEMEFEAAEAQQEREEEKERDKEGIPSLFLDEAISKGFTRIINGYEAPHRPWMVQVSIVRGKRDRAEAARRQLEQVLGHCGGK